MAVAGDVVSADEGMAGAMAVAGRFGADEAQIYDELIRRLVPGCELLQRLVRVEPPVRGARRDAAAQAVVIDAPDTVIAFAGSGRVAGPVVTAPSATANLLPWHGRTMFPPSTVATVQLWCV